MFNLFRKQEPSTKPEPFKGIYIDGNLYSRCGSDVCMTTRDSDEVTIMQAGHTAPNDVSIAQIAYAIAIIEGYITIGHSHNPYSQASSGIGLN